MSVYTPKKDRFFEEDVVFFLKEKSPHAQDYNFPSLQNNYLIRRKNDLLSIKRALKEQKFSKIERIANQVLGSSEMYEFNELKDIALTIQKSLKMKNFYALQEAIKSFENLVNSKLVQT